MSDQAPQLDSVPLPPELPLTADARSPSATQPADRGTPVGWLEVMVLGLLVSLTDISLYQGRGYSGVAALVAIAPLLLLVGAQKRHFGTQTLIVLLLAIAAAVRLVWCGNPLAILSGATLLAGVSLSLAGGAVYLLELLNFALLLVLSGAEGLQAYEQRLRRIARSLLGSSLAGIALIYLLPLLAAAVFITVFILANPDLVSLVNRELSAWLDGARLWLQQVVESPQRVLIWLAATWIGIGLLRPLVPRWLRTQGTHPEASAVQAAPRNEVYLASRNTILTVVVVFAGYLVFEFATMWFRTFPPKFHYSGYAHEGAAWLTVALGLATLLLSAIFRGSFMHDARMPFVRKMAMIWAAENILLAVAVYNRLAIYVQFNGMTQMRVVGLLGTTTVVVGFLLVVWKIWHACNFQWLIRNQLLALAMAIYLFAILPVDLFVNWYNVRQILAGNPAPSVQISHHPTSSEGRLMWLPLLAAPDPIIRDGIAEMLQDAKRDLMSNPPRSWHARQLADEMLQRAFEQPQSQLVEDLARPGAAATFKSYSYQWY